MVALNFPSVFGQSIILLLVYQALALLLLWAFRASPKPALLRILHLSDESSRVRRQTARSRLPVAQTTFTRALRRCAGPAGAAHVVPGSSRRICQIRYPS
jgi:hypothetical protein